MSDNELKDKLESFERRKEELRREIRALENELGDGISELQDGVYDRFKPTYWIKKYPLRIVGTAVLVGFLAGSRDNSGSVAGVTVTASIVAALKTLAARKLVDQIVHIIENKDEDQ